MGEKKTSRQKAIFFYIVNNSLIVTHFYFPCRCTFKNIFNIFFFFFYTASSPVKQPGNQILRSAPFRCFRGHCLSLLQGHDLHCLAVQRDRVFYACGDRCHGHLDRPVALSQAGHDSLVHADRDLDQTLGGRSDESILLYRFKPQIATNAPHKMQHWVSERNTWFFDNRVRRFTRVIFIMKH